jgi:cholesterol oxidase
VITSSFTGSANHLELARHGKGASMALLQATLADGDRGAGLGGQELVRHPVRYGRVLTLRNWSQRTLIALVMQSLDNSLTVHWRRSWYGRWRLRTTHGAHRTRPGSRRATRRYGVLADGSARRGGTWSDAVNMPVTAHILGGAVIGAGPQRGVVDATTAFGHRPARGGDGAAVSANLGVNPALTIGTRSARCRSG